MKYAEDRSAGAGRRIARNAAMLTATRVAADALGLLLFVAISRSLGPAGTGAYSYAFAVATLIFFVTSLGIDTYGVREYLRLPATSRATFLAELLGTQLLIIGATFLILNAYVLLVAVDPNTLGLMAAFTFFQVANSLAQTLFVPATADQRFNQSALALFVGRFVAFVPTAVCVEFLDFPLTRAVLAFPVAGMVVLVLAIYRALRDGVPLRPSISLAAAKRVGPSLWTFASAELISQAFPRIGLIVAGTYLGHAPAGLYAAGMKMLELACVPVSLLGIAAFPRLAQLHDSRPPAFQQLAVQLLWILVLTSGGIGWIMYFVAPYLAVTLLGKAFVSTEPVIKMMALVGVAQAAETVLWPLLLASGQQVARLRFAVIALACNLVLSVALAPALGLNGVISASAVSYFVMALLFFTALRRAVPNGALFCAMAGLITATVVAWFALVLTRLGHSPRLVPAAVVACVYLSIVALFYGVSRYLSKVDHQIALTRLRAVAGQLPSQPRAQLRYAVVYDAGSRPDWQRQALSELAGAAGGDPIVNIVRGATAGDESPGSVGTPLSWCDDNREAITGHLRSERLDFIVCLSDFTTGRALVNAAAYGVWAFHFGDWCKYRGAPAGFWEVYAGEPVSTAMLVRLCADEHSVVPLKRATLRTKRHSYHSNARQLEARCVHWAAQVAREIQVGATTRLTALPLVSTMPWRHAPNPGQRVLYAIRVMRWLAAEFVRSTFISEQWNIGIINQPIQTLLTADALPPIRWLPKLRSREFIADPFGVVRDGQLTILCEHYDYATGRGRLIAIDPERPEERTSMHIGPQPTVHLSYPHVLEIDGELLCIPESVQAHEVVLYRCERFPDLWRRAATLIADVDLVDVTLFRHENRWWLAGSDSGAAGASSELHLWYADQLLGPWYPHLANPVKVDVRSARPGGTVFWSEGELYRPAQDCATCYGRRIVINRIVKLTPREFAEDVVKSIEPVARGPYPAGLHTLSAAGSVTLIDSKRWVFAKEELPRAFGRIFSMSFGRRERAYEHPITKELTAQD